MAIKRLCSMVVVATLVLMGPAVLERPLVAQEPGPPQMRAQLSRMPSLAQNVWPADFNRDGITDLVAGRPSGEILVAFGHGDGTFTAEQVIATGFLRPIPGDVDGDGDADVIVNGAVIPGNGTGTFGPPVASAVETSAVSNQVRDFNGDGHLDLARLDGAAVTIYPGNGDLTFGPSVRLSAPPGGETFSLAVGDINSDGRPDIGVATASWVDLFVNQGGLTYSHSRLTMGQLVLGLTFWDLNGDGVLDTIVSSGTRTPSATPIWVSGFVHVLLGNGDGTFQDPLTFVTNNGPRTAVAGDFNGDGLPDIATGNLSRGRDSCDSGHLWDSISLLPGLGNGQLGPPTSYALGNDSTPGSVDVSVYRNRHDLLNTSDLNGDGHTDLIASPGAILLATEPAENNIPVVDAGPSQTLPTSETHHLRGSATDADNDWLTFRWTDQTGAVVGTVPQPCFSGSQFPGVQTFTLTVTDGHGGVATESVTHHIQPSFLPPTTWSGNAIGDMTLRGEAIVAESSAFVRGAGADIWGTADGFQFAHQALSGDFEITARVASVENIHPWTKAGIMIRDGLSSSARHAFLFATPTATNGVAFQRRVNTGELTVHTSGPAISPPAWLQLRREGDLVSAFVRESESAPWTLVGTEMLGGLPSGVRVGFAVTSHDEDTFAVATFDNVTITPLGSALPSGWNSTDVGAIGMPGSVVSDGSSFTVQGSGADIWGTTDAFQFAYRRLTGSGAIVARATDLAGPHAWSKAGVMIRDSLDPSSAHHFLLLSEAHGAAYQRRPNHGDVTLHTGLGEATVAPWFAISWSPSGPIRLFYSADGITWTQVATTSFPAQDGEVYLGLAVTSHESNQLATAMFDNVAVSWGIGVTDLDIGTVGVAGSALFDGRRHIVSGSGADVWRSVDAFHYSFRTLPANGGIMAAVTAFDAPHEWSKAGLMIRASTDPSASHAFVLVSRDHGIAFQRRTLAGGVTTHTDDGGRPALVPWLMLVRAGPVIVASVSYDGIVWHDLGADVFPEMGSGPVLVGLAVTSHDNAAVATATFEHVIEE